MSHDGAADGPRRGPPPADGPAGIPVPDHRAGLCSVCRHHRITGNRRGSRFYLCELSASDPDYSRYPPLPVLRCRGFERGPPDPWAQWAEEEVGGGDPNERDDDPDERDDDPSNPGDDR